MSVFASRDPSRRRRTLGSSGTLMSNPNNMANRDAELSYRSKIRLEHAHLRRASPGNTHRVPETPQIIDTVRAKTPRSGPASFLKLFRNIDADDGGTIDFAEFMQFLGYFHMGSDEAVCREVFDSFDPDGSGDISMQEFLQFFLERPDGDEIDLAEGNRDSGDGAGGADGGGKRVPATMIIGTGVREVRPPPKDTQSIGMSAEDIIDLVREKVENRTPGKGGRVKTSFTSSNRAERDHTPAFFQVLRISTLSLTTRTSEEIWRTFDTDGDGTLDFDEFIEHFISDT